MTAAKTVHTEKTKKIVLYQLSHHVVPVKSSALIIVTFALKRATCVTNTMIVQMVQMKGIVPVSLESLLAQVTKSVSRMLGFAII